MEIAVCVKRVPASMEDIELTEDGEISDKFLTYSLNEYDGYALEEAVQIKEELGGNVRAITVDSEEADEILKLCIARGADEGIRISNENLEEIDTHTKAKIISNVLKELDPDLIFTGLTSEDENHGQLGVEVAEILGRAYASGVEKLNLKDEKAEVVRSLEAGLKEELSLPLPAVLTLQTGINEPRYASIMARRRVDEDKISVKNLSDLGLDEEEVKKAWPFTKGKRLYRAPTPEMAEIFEGDPEEISEELSKVLSERGLVS
ncbi:MAG: electron transfer flavoprotein subunit beta/FixA family protein [Candidatus Hadarchaeia archaeon]